VARADGLHLLHLHQALYYLKNNAFNRPQAISLGLEEQSPSARATLVASSSRNVFLLIPSLLPLRR
ncbi:hypothetical protein, partial [Tolypothrix sp. VBCCA 56010]|uniref:hypothetical protein n=1 Tax=Tolypothrix sp. VBCCA 56010 TaxID=3137731 RepID=UPI003D7D0504